MIKAQTENQPPKLVRSASGEINANSLADLLEWFLNYDPRVALVRRPEVEALFQWKQQDDKVNGAPVYPFENAEARFAVGVFQAVTENNSESELQNWITQVLQALGEAKQTNEDIAKSYKLETNQGKPAIEEGNKIPSLNERRFYLTSCWLEALLTAEVRFLGWVYRELYGKDFQIAEQ